MADNSNYGFGKFVPGFDFLQNIAKGASQTLPQMPNLSNWIAPTLNVEELDKRIGELKAVHFWLDQNSKALGATIQALEVQKMTLATLKGMNFSMADMANALKLKGADTMMGGLQKMGESAAGAAKAMSDAATDAAEKSKAAARKKAAPKKTGSDGAGKPAGIVDPMQWWGALTQQFQQIAADAMKDVGAKAAMTGGAANDAAKPPAGAAKKARKRPAKKKSG